jgi:hypothetical protein
MPNWVTNNLNIAEKDLETFKKLALDENGMIDFNILIPRPKDLDITAGSYEWYIDKYGFNKEQETRQNTLLKPVLDKLYNENLSQDEFVKLAYTDKVFKIAKEVYNLEKKSNLDNILRGYYNLRKHGYANWYEWSCAEWGTKWNASETYGSGSHFTFDTAWNCPFEWLLKLSKHIDFKGSFADEDLGSNLGTFETENGKLLGGDFDKFSQDELYYIANMIKGYDENTYEEWIEYDDCLEPISEENRVELDKLLVEYI